jgi:ribosomal protein S16
LKLNGTHQLLYADDVKILDEVIHTVKKNTEFSVVASKQIGLESNTDRSKYMVIFRVQNARGSHKIKRDNSSIERMGQFKYLETTLTNRNYIREEIKSTLKSGSACYHSVQNLLSSSLLSKNINMQTYRTIIFPVVLYECET